MEANEPESTEQVNRQKFVDFVELLVQEAECRLQENLEKRIASWEKWLEEEKEQLDHKDKTDLTEAVGSVKRGMLMEGKMLKRIKRSIKAQRRLSDLMNENAKNRQAGQPPIEGNNVDANILNRDDRLTTSALETGDVQVTPDDVLPQPSTNALSDDVLPQSSTNALSDDVLPQPSINALSDDVLPQPSTNALSDDMPNRQSVQPHSRMEEHGKSVSLRSMNKYFRLS